MNVNPPSLMDRLAVCSWSLQPTTADDLVRKVQATGLSQIQLALDPLRENPSDWPDPAQFTSRTGLRPISGMFVTIGEDYSSLESIRRTGGVVPDETWEANWKNALENVVIARKLGLQLVTFHAGFIPHEASDPLRARLINRISQLAELYGEAGIELGFETGQETADDLAHFLEDLGQSNVGVNFDPANLLLYEKGDPIAALRRLRPYLRQIHLKDARTTQVPGTWGEEVTVGTGDVDWPAFFDVLNSTNYQGYLALEREAGNQRGADLNQGKEFVLALSRGTR